MKLYYVPRTRSSRPRWVLEELGVPYELVRLDPKKGETKTPAHLARHPLGHVPVLEVGPEGQELRLFESMAICLYLAERHGDGKLLPPPGTAERARVYQWILYGVTEIESQLNALAGLTFGKPEAEWDRPAVDRARERVVKALAPVDAALAGREWIATGDFTLADLLLASLASYASALGVALPGERLPALVGRAKARPAFRRAIAD